MTINEFSNVCKDFFAEHDDFKGVVHILSEKSTNDGDLIGFSGMKGTNADIFGMCLIMCDKAGISMREVAAVTKRLANDPHAMAALANINKDDEDDEDEKNDEAPKKCCGECNRKEDSKEDGKPSREDIAKMLVDMLFGD
nr:MAG TPA: hypothetical protein [Bacteriophage sp.]